MIPSDSEGTPEPTPQQTNIKQKSALQRVGNLPLIYFLCGAILSIICSIVYIMDNNIGYIVSGPIGLSVCLFGIKYFRPLIQLKHEIDQFSKMNHKFKNENKKIEQTVDVLYSANDDLTETKDRINRANQKNRENLNKFRELQDNMGQSNASSIEQLHGVTSKCKVIENKWKQHLYLHERRMLHIVFDRFCSNQSHIGMNKAEFDEFTLALPIEYQDRFKRIGNFDKMSGNKDIILFEDFEATLDIFAEMQALDCDIEFEIKSTKKLRNRRPSEIIQQKKMQRLSVIRQSPVINFIINEENEDEIGSDIDIDANYNIDDDDRKYDDDLIRYKSEIVITRYSRVLNRRDAFIGVSLLSDDEENEDIMEIDTGEVFRETNNPNVSIRDITVTPSHIEEIID